MLVGQVLFQIASGIGASHLLINSQTLLEWYFLEILIQTVQNWAYFEETIVVFVAFWYHIIRIVEVQSFSNNFISIASHSTLHKRTSNHRRPVATQAG
jgi:hypothetical protein